ncbi:MULTISPECIES: hypothetical protein [Gabonibacter]|uniref:hypothetical protein n=1 Tax=Gabonibacter TaxID=1911312 RepID=UPI00073EAE57|nr:MULTISPECIES: hypothetical protein [Gabonibacter]MCR9011567.1 hypothetical protein [Gabonibacter chumensis]
MIEDFLVNFGSSIAFVFLGSLASWVYRTVNTVRPVKKLWRISHPQELIICTATSTKTNTGKYLRPATGIGQVRALGHAVESLSKAYNIKIDNILFSDDQVQKKIEKDIIILGGPKNNIISKLFLDKFREAKDIVYQTENTISWKTDQGVEEYNGIEEDQKVIKDYGVVIRGINPFSSPASKSTFCLFTGCHTYGTIAAANYFTEIHVNSQKIISKGKKNIVLLVECDVLDGFPVCIKKIKEYEF